MPYLEILHNKKDALSLKCSLFIKSNKNLIKTNEITTPLGAKITIKEPSILRNKRKLCIRCYKTSFDLCSECFYKLERTLEQLEKQNIALGIPRKD